MFWHDSGTDSAIFWQHVSMGLAPLFVLRAAKGKKGQTRVAIQNCQHYIMNDNLINKWHPEYKETKMNNRRKKQERVQNTIFDHCAIWCIFQHHCSHFAFQEMCEVMQKCFDWRTCQSKAQDKNMFWRGGAWTKTNEHEQRTIMYTEPTC
jgi:hypothetical protein